MVLEGVDALFDEFAAAWARGERPDPQAYLARAGSERSALAALIEGWVLEAPAPEPSEDEVAVWQARLDAGEPPLVTLRVRRGWKRDRVVELLLQAFGIPAGRRERAEEYWHELETGLRAPSAVSERLWAWVVATFGEAAEAARAYRPAPPKPAMYRLPEGEWAAHLAPSRIAVAASPESPAEAGADELDRLFDSRL